MQTNLDALLNGSEYRRLFDRNTCLLYTSPSPRDCS